MPTHPFDDQRDELAIAIRLVRARLDAKALEAYPGPQPQTLDAGYRIQDQAIALWHRAVAGWKVGRIPDAWQATLGEDRLVGPIFAGAVQNVPAGQRGRFPVIERGFAAIEAEYVFTLGSDAPAGKTEYSEEEAADLVASLSIGIELAGSPLASINRLGPAVVVSDFGNNAGLIVGPAIAEWRRLDDRELTCESFIDQRPVGTGGAASIPGGPLAALAFALGRCARRGHPLKAGMHVTTGAATGIHDILAGQSARVDFGRWGRLGCETATAIATTERRP
ncbi:2-keto-4-pentenoate hydratase [Lysobacter sp. 1R34A]|uniref:2-keto-4-pentenoate hydratase n=1 Tax=Lysobacter sp. 1R34A TaxID=3445786 RepID=UPI003EEA60E1